jgi:glycosyltransferase involved in cell wall biosynthesis
VSEPLPRGVASSARRERFGVLYLAFYYPPLGGAGVQRAAKFAKYLPEFGFDPVVVTGRAEGRTPQAPLDASLAGEARAAAQTFRTSRELPGDSRPGRLQRWLGARSPLGSAWRASCEETGLEAASRAHVDVILASMSPFETCEAANALSQRLGIPWVADLRDPWALDEMIVYPTRWHRALELRRMRRLLGSAALVVMNTPEAARALRDAFPGLAARTIAIPNGYDAADFAGAAPARADDRFRVVHTGSLHVRLGLEHRRRRRLRALAGGERVPVDILTRSHFFLLRALERWRAEAPDEAAHCELWLAGDLSLPDHDAVARSRVADLVRMPGYVSHADSVALLRGADLLFLPMHALPPGCRARIVPGKTYEYLAAGRPILAAVPEGDARDFVLASGRGDVCEPADEAAMCGVLRRRFARWREAGREPMPPSEYPLRFERRALTRELALALEAVILRARR